MYYEALICSIVEGTLSTEASEGLVDMFKKVTEKELMSSHDRQKTRGDIGQRAIYIYAVRIKHNVYRLELKHLMMEKNEAWPKTPQVAAGWGVPTKSKRKEKGSIMA